MRRKSSAKTASAGVSHTRITIEDNLNWLFREQPSEDYGIDAHAEIVDGEDVRGRLLALQIKSGLAWFTGPGPGGWWFRPKIEHVQYWINHSLPVVVVLYHPERDRCYWQLVKRETLVETSTGNWKLLVPESNVLDSSAAAALREAAEGDPYVLRIRDLQLAKPWMEMLESGKRLVVDMQEWINKTSGRGLITLGVDNEDGAGPTPLATWGVFIGHASYAEVVPRLFAWADVDVHEETYDNAEYDRFEAECVYYDNEGDRIVTESYEEWKDALRGLGLRPYTNAAGEVDYWRLELTLNSLGKAFLVVDEFAAEGERQLII